MALSVDIEKTLGSFHLKLAFEAGDEVLSLFGASGCGKSMTLMCIAGIEKPDRGRIVLDGRTLFDSDAHIDLPPQKRRVGYLFQQYALFPNMTVAQNIACGVRDRTRLGAVLPEILRSMHLDGLEDKRPAQLSGGQQQRVALARILVNEPEVLLLDEPFSALDSHLRFQLEEEVRSIIRSFGRTVLFVSHNREEVYRLSRRIALMRAGEIEMIGGREAVFAAPRSVDGALLTGCRNLSRIEKIDERRVRALDWNAVIELGCDAGDAKYIGVRAHELHRGPGENTLHCTVTELVENPFSVTVNVRPVGEGTLPLSWRISKKHWELGPGDALDLSFSRDAILLLKE